MNVSAAPASQLARQTVLADVWNASNADVADRFDPLDRQAFERLPGGDQVFRGIPLSTSRPDRATGSLTCAVPDRAAIGCAQADWEADSEAMIRGGINITRFARGVPRCLRETPDR